MAGKHKVSAQREVAENQAVWGQAGEALSAGDLCYASGYTAGVRVFKAAVGTTLAQAQARLLVAQHDMASGVRGPFLPWADITSANTAAGAVGDKVYLSSSTAGGWQIAVPTSGYVREVGELLVSDASEGVVVLEPSATSSAGATANAQPSMVESAGQSLTSPNNAFPQDLFPVSGTVSVPYDGDWLVVVNANVSWTGTLGGTALAQAMWLQATVGGTETGRISLVSKGAADDYSALTLVAKLTGLSAGDTIGASIGFGADQGSGTLGVGANAVLYITPTT